MKKEDIINVLKKVNDPELMIDIWTLGLIYDIDIQDSNINIKMTFTTPMCPYGPFLVDEIKKKIKVEIKAAKEIKIDVVFEPLWQPSEEVKNLLGINI